MMRIKTTAVQAYTNIRARLHPPNALVKLRRITARAPVSAANRRTPNIGVCFSVR